MGRTDVTRPFFAPWVGRRPYWACVFHHAALVIRGGIAEEKCKQELDRRVVDLVRAVHALPGHARRCVVVNLCERLRSDRSRFGDEQGYTHLGRLRELLCHFEEACNS